MKKNMVFLRLLCLTMLLGVSTISLGYAYKVVGNKMESPVTRIVFNFKCVNNPCDYSASLSVADGQTDYINKGQEWSWDHVQCHKKGWWGQCTLEEDSYLDSIDVFWSIPFDKPCPPGTEMKGFIKIPGTCHRVTSRSGFMSAPEDKSKFWGNLLFTIQPDGSVLAEIPSVRRSTPEDVSECP